MPNIPLCVLRGHSGGGEACTAIAWIDTPRTAATDAAAATQHSSTSTSTGSSSSSSGGGLRGLGLHQHVLSAGREGRVLVQDAREGYFPREHIARSIAVLSSQVTA